MKVWVLTNHYNYESDLLGVYSTEANAEAAKNRRAQALGGDDFLLVSAVEVDAD